MKKLINIENQDGTLLVSSREVAENFDKNNQHINESIRDIEGSVENSTHLFNANQYVDSMNRKQNEYLLTRDGLSLLVMGFTGQKALNWKLKYIEAFNKMEEELKRPKRLSVKEELKLHYQAMGELDEEVLDIKNEVTDMKENMPLFNVECDELQAWVRSTGVKVLGGYKSTAYDDNSIRGKVYADIQNQLKRQFGVKRYKGIKRVQLDQAINIIKEYEAPLILQERIRIANNQMKILEGGRD